MYSFLNDYSEGAHPRILERLAATNLIQADPYCNDIFCEEARNLIRKHIQVPGAPVHFFFGGTPVNLAVITAYLRPYQGVVSADTGHINTHEAGAIEAAGHKILTIESSDGKLDAGKADAFIQAYLDDPIAEHTVQPGMVYISNPTEAGTVYKRAELEALSGVCRRRGLPLYMDGARLGCALASPESDLGLPDFARLTDAFYIGGTKMGALMGEALVILDPALDKGFRSLQKQRGGMMAKGRLVGIQFLELFTGGLYLELALHANAMARRLREGISSLGYGFLAESPANQVFPIFPNKLIARLREEYDMSLWQPVDDTHTAVRLCTSWATPPEPVEGFLRLLEELKDI